MFIESFTMTLFVYLVGAVLANNVALLFVKHYAVRPGEELESWAIGFEKGGLKNVR